MFRRLERSAAMERLERLERLELSTLNRRLPKLLTEDLLSLAGVELHVITLRGIERD
jgi:hypothetical protein